MYPVSSKKVRVSVFDWPMTYKLDWKVFSHVKSYIITRSFLKTFFMMKGTWNFLNQRFTENNTTRYLLLVNSYCKIYSLILFGKSPLLTQSLILLVLPTSSLCAVWIYGFITTLGFCQFFTFGIIISNKVINHAK